MAHTLGVVLDAEDFELTLDQLDMAREALRYLSSFKWFRGANTLSWATGVPGVIGVFLVTLTEKIENNSRLWAIVGDIPSAYLVVNPGDDAFDAINIYGNLMLDWCDAVENGGNLKDVFPVEAESTAENSADLRSRIGFILNELPNFALSAGANEIRHQG